MFSFVAVCFNQASDSLSLCIFLYVSVSIYIYLYLSASICAGYVPTKALSGVLQKPTVESAFTHWRPQGNAIKHLLKQFYFINFRLIMTLVYIKLTCFDAIFI